MSQHQLEPILPRYRVMLGWDPPLANFFLQVFDEEADEEKTDPVIVWLGADGVGTEPKVDPVLAEAAKWAIVPEGLREQLLDDQKAEGTRTEIAALPFLVLLRKRD